MGIGRHEVLVEPSEIEGRVVYELQSPDGEKVGGRLDRGGEGRY